MPAKIQSGLGATSLVRNSGSQIFLRRIAASGFIFSLAG
jgi:hypothetical protein